jgi:hypothetical protein
MNAVRLYINSLEIHRQKKQWSLYFVTVMTDRSMPGKLLVSVLPENQLHIKPDQDNKISFDASGMGLFIAKTTVPDPRHLIFQLHIMHTLRPPSDTNRLLGDIKRAAGNSACAIFNVFETIVPWLVLDQSDSMQINHQLRKNQDRSLAIFDLSTHMVQHSGNTTEEDHQRREGDVTLVYSCAASTE